MNGTYYLNNSGSRWVSYSNGIKSSITLKTRSGIQITRKVSFYESWGNYVLAHISYKGKKIRVFGDAILED
jgi:hypothetical protein